jgi:glycogen debranching enzyme
MNRADSTAGLTPAVTDTVRLAQETLNGNWRDGFTVPSARLYPFQWNWDAGFSGLGFAYFDPARAYEEIRSMFRGQWSNGMVPHIVFHRPNPNYFPGPGEWLTERSPHAPDGVQTSGITQNPVFGFVLERMAQPLSRSGDPHLEAFLRELFPKVVAFHRYLYRDRDPDGEGLVYVHHNWESMDNSPLWDDILARMDVSRARDVSALRQDNKRVAAAERPSDENYKRYLHLVDLLKSVNYEEQRSEAIMPMLVQDVLFNALLIKSNHGLIAVAERLGLDAGEIVAWNRRSIAALNAKLWDPAAGCYFSHDLRTGRSIPIKVVGGLMPLFAGACSPEQARSLVHQLEHSFVPGPDWNLCPSCAADEAAFDPVRYWRGPVWVNLNWMLHHGLRRYGFAAQAARVRETTLRLIERHGMFEYFDPRPVSAGGSDHGLGADAYSWTAALYLDFVRNDTLL